MGSQAPELAPPADVLPPLEAPEAPALPVLPPVFELVPPDAEALPPLDVPPEDATVTPPEAEPPAGAPPDDAPPEEAPPEGAPPAGAPAAPALPWAKGTPFGSDESPHPAVVIAALKHNPKHKFLLEQPIEPIRLLLSNRLTRARARARSAARARRHKPIPAGIHPASPHSAEPPAYSVFRYSMSALR